MSLIGTRVKRVEDPDLLTVGGKYVDDLAPSDALHVTFVRSTEASARIVGTEVAEARALPGIVGVYTATDLELVPRPPSMPMLNQEMTRTWLAADRVRYVGEPVVAIVSETRQAGVDAADLVWVDYEPLDAAVTLDQARGGDILLFDGLESNACFAIPGENADDFFADCEVVVDALVVNNRIAPAPLEPRSTIAMWGERDGRPHLTQWATTQNAHGTRDTLAGAFGLESDQVRVICPDVGGGFGAKNGGYPEDLMCSLLAQRLGRPMRWAETRSESMLGLVHARACEFKVSLGGDRDGRIKAYRFHYDQDAGAFPAIGAVLPFLSLRVVTGVYDIPKVEYTATSWVTNTNPIGAYRGAGRPEATHAIERVIDIFADEIGVDPVEVRRRNFVAEDAFPYTTAMGTEMDSGRYEVALDKVLDAAGYPDLRAEQQRRLADDSLPLLGLGWCAYVEIANPLGNDEYGSIQVRPDGSALVLTGSSSHGQGHHTAFAQVAADATGIPFDRIEVRHGDTDEVPRGGGTGGSKSLQVGGSAVRLASDAVVDLARQAAADMLEAAVDDIVLDVESGTFSVAGTPAVSKTWAEVAAEGSPADDAGLFAEADFNCQGPTFPFGVHLSVVEVDRDTGAVTPIRHVSCDDAGVIVNPMIVDGQVHGGAASGVAQAFIEDFAYDADGNPQSANFMDYGIPSAAELPSFERLELETPTHLNPLGAKGIGESGTIGATPAVQNAIIDAVKHLGIHHIDIPCTPQKMWRLMQA